MSRSTSIEQIISQHSDIISNAEVMIIRIDKSGKIIYINYFAERQIGLDTHKILYQPFLSLISSNNNSLTLKEIISKAYFEDWFDNNQGKRVFVGWKISKTDDGYIFLGSDITEQKILQNALHESQNKFEQVFNSITDSILIIDPDTYKVIEANNVSLYRNGYNRQQLNKLYINDFIPESFVKQIPHLIDVIKEKLFITLELKSHNQNGKQIPIEVYARIFEYGGKEMILAVGRDITERKITQNRIYNAVLKAEEKERHRIAKKLHDEVSPILTTLKLYTQSITSSDFKEIKSDINTKIEQSIKNVIDSITDISDELSPQLLDKFGLQYTIESYIEKIKLNNNINITFNNLSKRRVDSVIEITIYRIFIELISNTIKHSKAQNVIIIFKVDSEIIFEYIDDGIGYDINIVRSQNIGTGIINIENRVKSIHGEMSTVTSIGQGTHVKIIFPFNCINILSY